MLSPGPYRIPNYRVTGRVRLSNKTPAGTYRAPGRYESTFVREPVAPRPDLAARPSTQALADAASRCKNLEREFADVVVSAVWSEGGCDLTLRPG